MGLDELGVVACVMGGLEVEVLVTALTFLVRAILEPIVPRVLWLGYRKAGFDSCIDFESMRQAIKNVQVRRLLGNLEM